MMENFPAHGGNLEWAARRYGLKPSDFIDFSSNVNPLGPPTKAIQAAREALEEAGRYPEPDAASLKTALSGYLGVGEESLMLGNGSTELIHHICRCEGPRRVTIAVPAFSEYERAARIAGAEVHRFGLSPYDGFSLEPAGLAEAAIDSDLTFFCNPGSPSGRLYNRGDLLPTLEACREGGGILVVDESFMGFCPTREAEGATLLPESERGNLVIISTLTKLFALAGLRGPGYLVAEAGAVSGWERAAFPWRVNTAAAAAAGAALGDGDYLRRTRELVSEWREDLRRGLEDAGTFEVYPSKANFLLLRILDAGHNAVSLADDLARRGMLIRACANFTGLDSRFARVAVRSPRNNARLIKAIKEVWE